MHISSQQLAELLIGIARAQAAIVQGLDKGMAHVRAHPGPTLVDLPVRLLLSTLERGGPDPANVARELERLCAGEAPSGSPGKDLDFGAPPP